MKTHPRRKYKLDFDGTTYLVEVVEDTIKFSAENIEFKVDNVVENSENQLVLSLEKEKHKVSIEDIVEDKVVLCIDGSYHVVKVEEYLALGRGRTLELSGNVVRAPLSGRVVKVHVSPGQSVSKGDRLLVIESMKMENVIVAPRDGKIKDLRIKEGATVAKGDVLAVFE